MTINDGDDRALSVLARLEHLPVRDGDISSVHARAVRIRQRRLRRAVFSAVAATVALAGAWTATGAFRSADDRSVAVTSTGSDDGGRVPVGWQTTSIDLTPHVSNPRQVFAASTYELREGGDACAQVPVHALQDLPATGAFVAVYALAALTDGSNQYPNYDTTPLPPPDARPNQNDAAACAARPDEITTWWFGIDVRGPHYVLVAYGREATSETISDAWSVARTAISREADSKG